ncbi:hypothetical protein H6P81_007537 [Aristolochia fimbriata]|uniref:Uncharacterized protein n=1 Tax=Aristolochia fimbriata TaxID=158543 RepID=A0AAV7F0V1_ARIFI|nr:hypothetical protein H6P81_007537 [Aristolochia fimbriata]
MSLSQSLSPWGRLPETCPWSSTPAASSPGFVAAKTSLLPPSTHPLFFPNLPREDAGFPHSRLLRAQKSLPRPALLRRRLHFRRHSRRRNVPYRRRAHAGNRLWVHGFDIQLPPGRGLLERGAAGHEQGLPLLRLPDAFPQVLLLHIGSRFFGRPRLRRQLIHLPVAGAAQLHAPHPDDSAVALLRQGRLLGAARRNPGEGEAAAVAQVGVRAGPHGGGPDNGGFRDPVHVPLGSGLRSPQERVPGADQGVVESDSRLRLRGRSGSLLRWLDFGEHRGWGAGGGAYVQGGGDFDIGGEAAVQGLGQGVLLHVWEFGSGAGRGLHYRASPPARHMG